MSDTFLDRIYTTGSSRSASALYDDWADTYEAEIMANGYATPGRIADALAKHVSDKAAPLLDFGCGTGLSGHALRTAGFSTIDGMDPSAPMLTYAEEKAVYRTLLAMDIDDPAPIQHGAYRTIAAIGVIGPGAAPPSVFNMLMNALPKGGHLGMSFNDHALREKTYEAALCNWIDPGAACLLFKEHGQHLPGQNIKSTVYIIEKS